MVEEDGHYCICCGWRPTVTGAAPQREPRAFRKKTRDEAKASEEWALQIWLKAQRRLRDSEQQLYISLPDDEA